MCATLATQPVGTKDRHQELPRVRVFAIPLTHFQLPMSNSYLFYYGDPSLAG